MRICLFVGQFQVLDGRFRNPSFPSSKSFQGERSISAETDADQEGGNFIVAAGAKHPRRKA